MYAVSNIYDVIHAHQIQNTDRVIHDTMLSLLFCRWFSLSCLRHGIHKALLDQYDLKVEPLNEVNPLALFVLAFASVVTV